MQTPVIDAERLILRPLALLSCAGDPALFRQLEHHQACRCGRPWPYSADGAETFVKQQLKKTSAGEQICHWVAVPRGGDGEAIGIIHFRPRADGKQGNRGFWLAEPYWNRGLMTEALTAVTTSHV